MGVPGTPPTLRLTDPVNVVPLVDPDNTRSPPFGNTRGPAAELNASDALDVTNNVPFTVTPLVNCAPDPVNDVDDTTPEKFAEPSAKRSNDG
jgi:hypothetical protein